MTVSETSLLSGREDDVTRLPMADRNVTGWEGPYYHLNERCAVLGCGNGGDERHHLWRKSFLVGDYWWVTLPNGEVIGNCVKLCREHHQMVTENKVTIKYLDDAYWWTPPEGDIVKLGWQPPHLADERLEVVTGHNPDECPTCHQKLKTKVEGPPEPKKPRRTWSLAVPKDDQENGAEVLEGLIEACREELAKAGIEYGTEKKVVYHVLTTSLALFVQHGQRILSDS